MTWLVGFIVACGALFGAIKGIVEFFEWLRDRNKEEPQDGKDEDTGS